jgi:hypothetical protein
MKTIYKTPFLILIATAMLLSCSKKSNVTPSNNINLLASAWVTNQWGGVTNNFLIFSVDKSTATGTVTALSGDGFGFTSGDVIYSKIKANSDGTYSCSAAYSATGSGVLSFRSATMSLQNSNTQLTVYYPALNSSFPAITYIYQKSSSTLLSQ